MSSIYQTTGQLRLEFPLLRNQSKLANSVEKAIGRLCGVRLVQINAITGIVMVYFDRQKTEKEELLSAVEKIRRHLGIVTSNAEFDRPRMGRRDDNLRLGMVIQESMERSAMAILGSMLPTQA